MKILLIGKSGQLGWELHRTLQTLGDVLAFDRPEIELTNLDSLRTIVRSAKPEIIVNAAAYTAVDQAEAEPDIAQLVNRDAPAVLAEEAKRLGACLFHYSTDYVFDGRSETPYTEAAPPNPLGIYGRSKLEGEEAVQSISDVYLILRTSWVYSLRLPSFVTKVLQWSRQQPELRIVTDQISSPTWCRSLAEATAQLLAKSGHNPIDWLEEHSGLYHLTDQGATSRYEWAQAILEMDPLPDEQVTQQIIPALSSDFSTSAERPAYSVLDCSKFQNVFGLQMPFWKASLRLALAGN